ncbi:MAG: hypothetical protein JST50_00545 [Bacteroidetes bacterium]|jgi:hypothetical protein|nr:hypothetical protein [Bacteroidota bacterium]
MRQSNFTLIFISLLTIISSCTNNVTDNLIKKAEQKCTDKKHSPCVITLNEVTKFQWDKLYLFPSWTNSDTISSRIGFEYTGDDVPDDNTRMLFTKGKQVVYEEDFKSLDYYNSVVEFQAEFDSLIPEKLHFLTPAQAIFTVESTSDPQACKGCYIYTFTPVKRK